MYPYLYTICLYSVYIPTHGRRVLRGLGAQGFPPPRPSANCSGGLALPLPQPGVLIHFIKLLIYAIFNCMLDPPSNLQIVHVQTMKRIDYYFVLHKICQQPISTAAFLEAFNLFDTYFNLEILRVVCTIIEDSNTAHQGMCLNFVKLKKPSIC